MNISTTPSPPTTLTEGFSLRDTPPPPPRRRIGRRLSGWLRRHAFTLLVLLPTVVAAAYYFGYAAPQFVSEARFVVRSRQPAPTGALAEALNQAGFRPAQEEAAALRDFLQSHAAVLAVRDRLDLVAMFRRPEADEVARLWFATPSLERLLDYYNRMVEAEYDTSSGIIRLRVRSFRPDDARLLAQELLLQSELLVNRLNQRLQEDTLAAAREDVARAEARLIAAQTALVSFRQRERAIDPNRSATIGIENIGRLEGLLAQASTELQEALRALRAEHPRVQVLRNRVDALTTQIAHERRQLAGEGAGMSGQVAAFERLTLDQQFARDQLTAANTAMERARSDTQRQQIFLLRLVEPVEAEMARYPKRFLSVGYVFLCLAVAYGLGWLLVAGMREHAA